MTSPKGVYKLRNGDLNNLLNLISEMPGYRRLLEGIKKQGEMGEISLLNAANPYMIAALHKDLKIPLIVITAKADNASRIKDQLAAWCDSDSDIDLFPEPDTLPYQRVTILTRRKESGCCRCC